MQTQMPETKTNSDKQNFVCKRDERHRTQKAPLRTPENHQNSIAFNKQGLAPQLSSPLTTNILHSKCRNRFGHIFLV